MKNNNDTSHDALEMTVSDCYQNFIVATNFDFVQLEWERRVFEETRECEACQSRNISANPISQQDDCSDYQSVKIEVHYASIV